MALDLTGRANRQVTDVDIRIKKTMKPYLFFDLANTTSVNLEGSAVYAMAKGARRIAFQERPTGTVTIEAQVYPFKFFSLFSDGNIETSAIYADTQSVTASAAGSIDITAPNNGTIVAGSVFAYPAAHFGEEAELIEGTFAENKFTASGIEADKEYRVGYLVNRTGVQKVSINYKKLPNDYYITMSTLDKDEDGVYTPFRIIIYKATIQQNFELSFSSEGDPASITATFDVLEDKDGNFVDYVELTEDAQ